MINEIINKVVESGLITLDLETYFPKDTIKIFDLKDFLFMGLILKEKDFRAALQTTDWASYNNCNVAITCTADAIVPVWAYMLAAVYLEPIAKEIVFGNEQQLVESIILKRIESIDINEFTDKRVVVKGCGETPIPEVAYVAITAKLRAVAKSIMYGEPCSTVPLYKKPVIR